MYFWFWVICGHFRGLGCIWVILKVYGYFCHFIGLKVFWSFFRFDEYFDHFLGLWGILVIL